MKLYSDEESDYICRDSRAVPLALRDQVFNLIMDDDHVSLFNPLGYQKRTYHTPTNVNLYSEAVSLQMGIEPAGFINEYNKRYDVWYKAMQDREDRGIEEEHKKLGLGGNESARVSGYDNVLQRLIEETVEEEASGIVASLGKERASHNKSVGQKKIRARERAEAAAAAEAEAVRQNAASSTIARRLRTRNEQNRPPVSPTTQPRLGGQDDQGNTPDARPLASPIRARFSKN